MIQQVKNGDYQMKILNSERVFVQYRDDMQPYEPIMHRKYTITHSDKTGELFVFIGNEYAEDQVAELRDELRLSWEERNGNYVLIGSVLIDDSSLNGNAAVRNKIFLEELPTALQAFREADRFLFNQFSCLNKCHILITFQSYNPLYYRTYDFGVVGQYSISK